MVVVPGMQLETGYHPKWYLTYHPVTNTKKPNTVRVTLDCAAKVAGKSFNDLLYQGSDTTACFVGVLLRLRREPVAVSVDASKGLEARYREGTGGVSDNITPLRGNILTLLCIDEDGSKIL